MSELDRLRGLGDQVVPPSFEVLREAARRQTRRNVVVGSLAAAAAVAAIVSAATLAVVNPDRTTPEPAPSPTITEPTPSPEGDGAVDRPLTYAVGQKIHYGDKVIDTGRGLVQLLVMDAGVVYETEDARLWFTDGSSTRMLDRMPGGAPDGYTPKSPAVGSLVAWVRWDGQDWVSLVVYDAAADEVVLEVPAGPGVFKLPTDGSDYEVFVSTVTTEQVHLYCDGCRGKVTASYDIATGERSYPTREEDIAEEETPVARTLGFRVRGQADNPVADSHLQGGVYYFDDGRLLLEIPILGNPGPGDAEIFVADPTDPVTGEVLRFAAPRGLREPRRPMYLFHWLDDGVFALVQYAEYADELDGAIVVCTVADLSCEVAVEGPWRGLLAGGM